jgi:hypothetical protein
LYAVNSYRELQSETAARLDILRSPEHTITLRSMTATDR